MPDDTPKKPDMPEIPPEASEEKRARQAALMKGLIKIAEQSAAMHSGEDGEALFTPEGKWGTPWPEGTRDDPPARWKLFGMRPASMLVQ